MYLVFNFTKDCTDCLYIVSNIRPGCDSDLINGDYICVQPRKIYRNMGVSSFKANLLIATFETEVAALQYATEFVGYKEFTIKDMNIGQTGRIDKPGHSLHDEVFIRLNFKIAILTGKSSGLWFNITEENDLVDCPVELVTIKIEE